MSDPSLFGGAVFGDSEYGGKDATEESASLTASATTTATEQATSSDGGSVTATTGPLLLEVIDAAQAETATLDATGTALISSEVTSSSTEVVINTGVSVFENILETGNGVSGISVVANSDTFITAESQAVDSPSRTETLGFSLLESVPIRPTPTITATTIQSGISSASATEHGRLTTPAILSLTLDDVGVDKTLSVTASGDVQSTATGLASDEPTILSSTAIDSATESSLGFARPSTTGEARFASTELAPVTDAPSKTTPAELQVLATAPITVAPTTDVTATTALGYTANALDRPSITSQTTTDVLDDSSTAIDFPTVVSTNQFSALGSSSTTVSPTLLATGPPFVTETSPISTSPTVGATSVISTADDGIASPSPSLTVLSDIFLTENIGTLNEHLALTGRSGIDLDGQGIATNTPGTTATGQALAVDQTGAVDGGSQTSSGRLSTIGATGTLGESPTHPATGITDVTVASTALATTSATIGTKTVTAVDIGGVAPTPSITASRSIGEPTEIGVGHGQSSTTTATTLSAIGSADARTPTIDAFGISGPALLEAADAAQAETAILDATGTAIVTSDTSTSSDEAIMTTAVMPLGEAVLDTGFAQGISTQITASGSPVLIGDTGSGIHSPTITGTVVPTTMEAGSGSTGGVVQSTATFPLIQANSLSTEAPTATGSQQFTATGSGFSFESSTSLHHSLPVLLTTGRATDELDTQTSVIVVTIPDQSIATHILQVTAINELEATEVSTSGAILAPLVGAGTIPQLSTVTIATETTETTPIGIPTLQDAGLATEGIDVHRNGRLDTIDVGDGYEDSTLVGTFEEHELSDTSSGRSDLTSIFGAHSSELSVEGIALEWSRFNQKSSIEGVESAGAIQSPSITGVLIPEAPETSRALTSLTTTGSTIFPAMGEQARIFDELAVLANTKMRAFGTTRWFLDVTPIQSESTVRPLTDDSFAYSSTTLTPGLDSALIETGPAIEDGTVIGEAKVIGVSRLRDLFYNVHLTTSSPRPNTIVQTAGPRKVEVDSVPIRTNDRKAVVGRERDALVVTDLDDELQRRMPSTDFHLMTGDTSPALVVQLVENGEPIDEAAMQNGTFRFRMEHVSKDESVNALAIVEDEETAEVAYSWSEGDTDTTGIYEAVFEVDFNDPEGLDDFDKDATFPPDFPLRIEINDEL